MKSCLADVYIHCFTSKSIPEIDNLCGRFLRKVPQKVVAKGSAEGFCGRFPEGSRKVPGRFSAEGKQN